VSTLTSSSAITESHPDLNTPQTDYSVVHFNEDGTPYLTDRYLNLCRVTRLYVLALARIGSEPALAIAQRTADCCRAGHVSKRCKRGKFAIAHRHHCGDHYCVSDSSGKYKFFKWAAKRDHAVFQMPHEALEIRFREHRPKQNTHSKKMYALRTATNTLVSKLTKDSVSVVAFAERIEDDAIRVVFPGKGSYSYTALKKILDELGFDNLTAVIKRGTTEELFWWAFGGFHDVVATMDADAKAALRVALIDYHTITTTGSLYSALSKEEMLVADNSPCKCPVCKDHDLEVVPLEERHTERIEDIYDRYEIVDWSREHLSPFLVRKGDLTYKSFAIYCRDVAVPILDAAPPT
jgi:hypothetical protein